LPTSTVCGGDTLQRLLRALSPTDEFIIVVAAALGPSIVRSVSAAFESGDPFSGFSDASLSFMVVSDVIVLAILAAFLHARGWTLERIGLGPNLKETLLGVALAVGTEIITRLVWLLVSLPSPWLQNADETFGLFATPFHPSVVIAVSIVNPIFEEAILCGYMLSALKGRTHWGIAAGLSIGVRTLCHVYQGIVGLIFIVPFGLIFTWCYLRYGRLWPLIVAHVLFDFVALLWTGRG
jgi:membrane protease YdiL (CAAX protease family)